MRLRPLLDDAVLRFEPAEDGSLTRVVGDLDPTDFTETWLTAVETAPNNPELKRSRSRQANPQPLCAEPHRRAIRAPPVSLAPGQSRTVKQMPAAAVAEERTTTEMASYVELAGLRTWYDERGRGDPLVLLHPGLVDSRAFAPNLDALAEQFHTFAPERRGHGHTPDVEGPISYELMAQDTIRFLDGVVGDRAHLVGCSDGAIVGLLVALRRQDLVRRLVCIAGVFHRDGWAPETLDANDVLPEFMAASYGEVSPDGAAHFSVVVEKLARMHAEEPTMTIDDLQSIRCRTLVMVGDDDEVTLEHAVALYRGLPNAELAVVPGTSHGLLVEKPDLCNTMLVDFLTTDPVPTLAPIRRRTA